MAMHTLIAIYYKYFTILPLLVSLSYSCLRMRCRISFCNISSSYSRPVMSHLSTTLRHCLLLKNKIILSCSNLTNQFTIAFGEIIFPLQWTQIIDTIYSSMAHWYYMVYFPTILGISISIIYKFHPSSALILSY